MTLSLAVFSGLEWKLLHAMKTTGTKLKNQVGKLVDKITYNKEKNNNIGNISPSFKRLSFRKLEKVKTSNEIIPSSKRRKNSEEEFILNDINSIKLKHENTLIRLPMSPKLKTIYNINYHF